MLNVMWASRIVLNPRDTPKAMNMSIREMPVTMSEFKTGRLLMPIKMARGTLFKLLIPMAAAVPMTVAMRADKNAIKSVL